MNLIMEDPTPQATKPASPPDGAPAKPAAAEAKPERSQEPAPEASAAPESAADGSAEKSADERIKACAVLTPPPRTRPADMILPRLRAWKDAAAAKASAIRRRLRTQSKDWLPRLPAGLLSAEPLREKLASAAEICRSAFATADLSDRLQRLPKPSPGGLFAAALWGSAALFFLGLFGRLFAAAVFASAPAAALGWASALKRRRTGEPLVFSDALLLVGALRSGASGAAARGKAVAALGGAAGGFVIFTALFLLLEPSLGLPVGLRAAFVLLPAALWTAGAAALALSHGFRERLLARHPLAFEAKTDAKRWGVLGAMPLHLASLLESGRRVLDAVEKPDEDPPLVIDPKRLRLNGVPRHLVFICAEGLPLSAAFPAASAATARAPGGAAPTLSRLATEGPSGAFDGDPPPPAGGLEFELLSGLSTETLGAWSFAPLRLAHAERILSPVWTERRMGRRTLAWIPLEADWLGLAQAMPGFGFEACWDLERIERWHAAAYGGTLPRLAGGLPDPKAILASAADFLGAARDPQLLFIRLPQPGSENEAAALLSGLDAGLARLAGVIRDRELLARIALCGDGRWLCWRAGALHEDADIAPEALLRRLLDLERRPSAAVRIFAGDAPPEEPTRRHAHL